MRIAGGTAKRIIKRIINFILVIWGVVTLSFCLQVFTGTDPAEMIVRKVNVFATEEQIQAVREELGLDAPFLERYTDYIKGVLTGDLGTAITNRQPVIENIKDALPVTCMLVVMAMAWVIIFTVLIAAISVIRKGGIFDNVMRIICIIGICVPSFWLALILLTAFAVQIPIFSVISDGSFKSLILPSVAMAVPIICIAARVLRAAVLNELKSDYVTYARARGFFQCTNRLWRGAAKCPPRSHHSFRSILRCAFWNLRVGGERFLHPGTWYLPDGVLREYGHLWDFWLHPGVRRVVRSVQHPGRFAFECYLPCV